jgi:hypothetical protein
MRQWWYYSEPLNYGPFISREEAAAAAFKQEPNRKVVLTGYGNNGAFFDIMWPRNPDYKEPAL